jgi:hypothetical protein
MTLVHPHHNLRSNSVSPLPYMSSRLCVGRTYIGRSRISPEAAAELDVCVMESTITSVNTVAILVPTRMKGSREVGQDMIGSGGRSANPIVHTET